MNRQYKLDSLNRELLPLRLNSITQTTDGYYIEYDGWHFEGKTLKATINQVLKYIFKGGQEW